MSESSGQVSSSNKAQRGGRWQLLAVVAILTMAVVVTMLTSDVTKVSEAGVRLVNGQPFLPERVGTWVSGKMEGLTEKEKNWLPQDTTGTRRRYTNGNGKEIICSVILAGKDVTSIHRPELCLPGQGWRIEGEQTMTVPVLTAHSSELKVMRMDAMHAAIVGESGRPVRMMFVYWFVGKDRLTPYHWQRMLWTMKDRVFHNCNHRWAYLLIAAPLDSEATQAGLDRAQKATQTVLTQFVQELYPLLQSDIGK